MNTFAFLGAGNLAQSLIQASIQQGTPSQAIWATRRSPDALQALSVRFPGVQCTRDNRAAIQACDTLVLAAKPQMMAALCAEIAPELAPHQLIISVAAGLSLDRLEAWLGADQPIVRAMPNTPSSLGLGAAGLIANAACLPAHRATAQTLFTAAGICSWLDHEDHMHAITALSGSGPAYFFLFMEAMRDSAIAQGLEPAMATEFAIQTAQGAAALAASSPDTLQVLRQKVTSPGGTTERAIATFEAGNLRQLIQNAMEACQARSIELAKL